MYLIQNIRLKKNIVILYILTFYKKYSLMFLHIHFKACDNNIQYVNFY